MIHPHTELRFVNERIGYGVFATRDIPRGTVVWTQDPLDRTIDLKFANTLPPPTYELLERYSFVTGEAVRVLCWDHAKYINHSCDATNLAPGGFEIEIAVRDIAAGEQLTDDYGGLNIEHSFECACESVTCRGAIHSDDFVRLSPRWDAQLREAFARLSSLDQPLWPWVSRPDDVLAVAAEPARMASSAHHGLATPSVARAHEAR